MTDTTNEEEGQREPIGAHEVMPIRAQDILREAAATQNTDKDPRAKDKAIDRAVALVKRMYPWLYR